MLGKVIKLTYDELTQEHMDIVEKLMEEFQYKCLESFGKVRNKVIQKSPLPMVSSFGGEAQDTEAYKRMFQDVVHEAVHEALINQLGFFHVTSGPIWIWTIVARVYIDVRI